jgi:hypothetical protein
LWTATYRAATVTERSVVADRSIQVDIGNTHLRQNSGGGRKEGGRKGPREPHHYAKVSAPLKLAYHEECVR